MKAEGIVLDKPERDLEDGLIESALRHLRRAKPTICPTESHPAADRSGPLCRVFEALKGRALAGDRKALEAALALARLWGVSIMGALEDGEEHMGMGDLWAGSYLGAVRRAIKALEEL